MKANVKKKSVGQINYEKSLIQQGRKEVMEWVISQNLLVADEPPMEGKPYQFLACHILKFGKTDKPLMALNRLSETDGWLTRFEKWGIYDDSETPKEEEKDEVVAETN